MADLLPSQQAFDFFGVTVISLLTGLLCRKFKGAHIKRLILGLSGLICAICYCRLQFFYILALVLVTTYLICSRYHPNIVFMTVFAIRMFSNILAFRFESWDDDNTITGSLLMITTLKAISVAYEVHAFRYKKGKGYPIFYQKVMSQPMKQEPTFLEIFFYLFCCVGQFTGPYYTFKSYYDGTSIPNQIYEKVRWKQHASKRLLHCLIVLTVHLIGRNYIGLDVLQTDQFYMKTSLTKRLFLVVLACYNGALFLIIGWIAAESACAIVGIGAYPKSMCSKSGQGPTKDVDATTLDKDRWDFETISNERFWKQISCNKITDAVREWNPCTQWWLFRHCYSADFISGQTKIVRLFFTMTMSAIWHGLKPGFFIGLWIYGLVAISERICMNIGKNSGYRVKLLHDALTCIFLRWISAPIAAATLMLQDFEPIYRLYKSVYFLPIIWLIVIPVFLKVIALSCGDKKLHEKRSRIFDNKCK